MSKLYSHCIIGIASSYIVRPFSFEKPFLASDPGLYCSIFASKLY